MTQLAQWILVSSGYAFLVFSIGWWVGYLSARRETRPPLFAASDARIATYRTTSHAEDHSACACRPNTRKRRVG